MELPIQPDIELIPPTPIRVETGLSRQPIHRLSRKGHIKIAINENKGNKEAEIKWNVSYNSDYGQPGPLAYKLDTLIINRRIEESPRPIPKIIKLGSLHDLCRELGISEGKNIVTIKRALHQNASAYITPKIRYKLSDGTEQTLETGFTRYSVIFTGQKLPNGQKADAVYIILNDIYMQVINGAMTRPLDYDYLKELPPAPQRFYELISFKMYAALKNDLPRAKLLYSELCTYAPLTRQTDWNVARPQLARIHAPHKKSGYIGKIDFQDTTDASGQPDWIMLYQPGPKARAEYRAFAKRGGPVTLEVEPFQDITPALPLAAPEPSPQEAALIGHGITPAKANELARQHDAETINTYVEYLEYEQAKKPGKIADPAAWLFTAFKDGRSKPKGFISREERQKREEAKRAKEHHEAEARRQEREKEAAVAKRNKAIATYWKAMTPAEQAQLDADSIAQADAETLAAEKGPFKKMLQQARRDRYIGQILDARQSDRSDA